MKLTKNAKSVKTIVTVMLVFILVLMSGCANIETTGEGHSILPFRIYAGIEGALSEGPHERRTGIGEGSIHEVNRNHTDFNPSWKDTGVSKHKNIPVSVNYVGHKDSVPNPSAIDGKRDRVRN